MERNDLVLYLDIPEFSEALYASKWRTDIVLPQAGDNICPENLLSEKTLAMLETVSAGEVWEDMKDDCRTMRRVVEHELFRVTERGFHLRRDGTPCCTLTLELSAYVTDKIVLLVNGRQRVLFGGDCGKFHTQVGVGIRFMIR